MQMAGILMSKTSEILFAYLNDILRNPSTAELALEELDEDFVILGNGLMYFAQCLAQNNTFAKALAKGDLETPLPPSENVLAAPLKSICANLKHLTWQSQQVAKGDYKQRVDFMGDFSVAFNTMIAQLAERQQKLEGKISQIQKKSSALEQSNLLLTTLMHYVPQQIIVKNRATRDIMLMNDVAVHEVNNDAEYIKNLMQAISISGHSASDSGYGIEILLTQGEHERYLMVRSYFLEWQDANAEIFVIGDISSVKSEMKKLEIDAYRDSLTLLYNRGFGMLTLEGWLHEKRQFALIFADLDNLKHINDAYGHNEGDTYIINTAKYLKLCAPNAVACRIGGDEFMLLVPNTSYDEAHTTMNNIYHSLQNDEYLQKKEYAYSISFGIAIVETDNELPASDILRLADERMYKHKRLKKIARQE